MTDNFFIAQKVPYLPQDYYQKTSNDQRKETQFSYMGFDGNGFKTIGSKLEEKGINEQKKGSLGSEKENGTFWTVCPYCYYMYQYESKYKECCLLCQHCRRGFHGASLAAPPECILVRGEESYYCSGYGFFPLGYSGDDFLGDKKKFGERDAGKKHDVVEIFSDSSSDDEEKVMDVKVEAVRTKTEQGLSNGEGRRGAMKRVKSVPSNSKKLMGRGVKRTIQKVNVVQLDMEFGNEVADIVSGSGAATRLGSGIDKNGGCDEDELEVFEGDDDMFVDLKDIC